MTTPAGTASSATAFPVVAPGPVILSFSPASGAPGTVVSLNGSNLAGVTWRTCRRTAENGSGRRPRPRRHLLENQDCRNHAGADTFNLRFFTSPRLTVDRTQNIEVRLLDADRTVMATAAIQLTAVGSLTVTLRLEDGESVVAGREAEIGLVIEKSRPSPELDLVVLNDAQLRAEGITAIFIPARTAGTMSKLDIKTLATTRVHFRARVDEERIFNNGATSAVIRT